MNLKTYRIGNTTHYATLKINNVQGGYIATGRTVQEAISKVFALVNNDK